MHRRKLLKVDNEDHSSSPGNVKHIATKDHYVFICLVALRILNVFLVHTWFVPDEYWQSLEVAHHLVYGYGYLTWEWMVGVRSYLHPSIFAVIFFTLKLFGIDDRFLLVLLPRLVEGLISAIAEFYFYKCIKRHFSQNIAMWTTVSLCLSWFWFYCCTRTLVNSLEAALVCFAMYLFPWTTLFSPRFDRSFIAFTITAGFSTAVRPTSVTVCIPLFFCYFYYFFKTSDFISTVFCLMKTFVIACFVLVTSLLIDRYGYGRWLSVHYNFLEFNLIKDHGSFYGVNPWHWYITQGIPVIASSHLPLILHGLVVYFTQRPVKKLTCCQVVSNLFCVIICLTTIVYSLPSHKEFRFILSLLPLFMVFCAISLSSLNTNKRRLAVAWLAATNIPAMIYFGNIHQSAPQKLIDHLANDIAQSKELPSILFLTPCHSTAYYSHLHYNVTMKFITCEPNVMNRDDYIDEMTQFYTNPRQWVAENLELGDHCGKSLPDRIVIFDVLLKELSATLLTCYHSCYKSFHTHFPEDRTSKYLHILCK